MSSAGRQQPEKIGEVLQVSTGMVQSHIKDIYRKFNVYSKQEFIDICHAEQSSVRGFIKV